ncbi:hypothetical protein T07_8989 [Trichinella nelsoni]|uniref:KRAB-A domain-containing protein 2 n=1 Tax=Trichinella nelsoni TaxID=6336 RepID=A0A0V0SJA3_9BILA|nr:hypothetical protein T07_8989 [Trichinella nelsoni]
MDRKAVFEEKFRTLIKEKGQNAQIFPTSQRDQIITDISRIQSDGPKSVRDYNSRNHEEMFDVISAAYQNIGHGGEKEHFKKLRINGLTSHGKHAICLPRFPLVSTNVMSRGQVDVINFQILLDVKTIRSSIKAARNLHNVTTPTTVKLARHPQSQGAIERLNGVVQEKLAIRMQEKKCKNMRSHELVLPKSLVDAAKTEEEIEGFLAFQKEANEKESLNRDGKNYEENESIAEKTFLHRDQAFIKAQEEAAAGSQNATLRVPDVDRGPADPKNFPVVIMAECEVLYTVGCREGKLSFKFTAADLQVISENLVSIDEVPDAEIPLRTSVI